MMLLMVMAAGCTTPRYVEVERVSRDTVERETLRKDSVVIKDSIVIMERGDSIIKDHFREYERFSEKIDTIREVRTDSIPVPVEVIKEQDVYRLHWWQTTLMRIGVVSLAVAVIRIRKKMK